ncbi:MAG: hypothetical protein V7643_5054 [Mycobacterium sp.]|jgi:hypothetical protein
MRSATHQRSHQRAAAIRRAKESSTAAVGLRQSGQDRIPDPANSTSAETPTTTWASVPGVHTVWVRPWRAWRAPRSSPNCCRGWSTSDWPGRRTVWRAPSSAACAVCPRAIDSAPGSRLGTGLPRGEGPERCDAQCRNGFEGVRRDPPTAAPRVTDAGHRPPSTCATTLRAARRVPRSRRCAYPGKSRPGCADTGGAAPDSEVRDDARKFAKRE